MDVGNGRAQNEREKSFIACLFYSHHFSFSIIIPILKLWGEFVWESKTSRMSGRRNQNGKWEVKFLHCWDSFERSTNSERFAQTYRRASSVFDVSLNEMKMTTKTHWRNYKMCHEAWEVGLIFVELFPVPIRAELIAKMNCVSTIVLMS